MNIEAEVKKLLNNAHYELEKLEAFVKEHLGGKPEVHADSGDSGPPPPPPTKSHG